MPIKERLQVRKALKDLSNEIEKLTGIQLENLNDRDTYLLNSLAAIVGIIAGYAAILLKGTIGFFQNMILQNQVSWETISFENHILGNGIYLLPPIGFIIVAALIKTFGEEAGGHGTPEVIEAVLSKGGKMKGKFFFVKAIASALTIASGGSTGREGPIIQMGATSGSVLGQWLKLPPKAIKILLACGAAGGLAASFNTPIAAVIFAVEVLLRELKTKSFVPLVIATVFASIIARAYYGNGVEFFLPVYKMTSPFELLLYLGLGILAGIFGVLVSRFFYKVGDFFSALPTHYLWKAMLGGFLISGIAYFYPQTLGVGYETMTEVLRGNAELSILLALILLKPLAMSITLASGASGGVFAPMLFTGAMFGGAYGMIANQFFPSLTANFGAYALVGMAAVFSSASRATFFSIVILFEMTLEYSIILPLMFACVVADQVSNLISKRRTLFSEHLRRKNISYTQEFGAGDSLTSITVANIMTTEVLGFHIEDTLSTIEKTLKETTHTLFPVIDAEKRVHGYISKKSFFKNYSRYKENFKAKDVQQELDTWIYPHDSLMEALQLIQRSNLTRVLVLDPKNKKLAGLLSGRDLLQLAQNIDT